MSGEYTVKQLCALTLTAIAAPLVMACAAVPWWQIIFITAFLSLYYIYIVWACGKIHVGWNLEDMLLRVWGKCFSKVILLGYLIWIILSASIAARTSAQTFPMDAGFPIIPIVLVLIGLTVALKGFETVCRFGSVLFFLVFALLVGFLLLAVPEIQWKQLRINPTVALDTAPLTVMLIPVMGLFFRGRLRGKTVYGRWFLMGAVVSVAISVVTIGNLGLALAQASELPFYYMSKSITVANVMERFEAIVSSLLTLSYGCLLTYYIVAVGKIAGHLWSKGASAAVLCALSILVIILMWPVASLPSSFWFVGNTVFWGLVPILTLGIVCRKKKQKIENNA